MSSSNHGDGGGYGNPPIKNRFSTQNQPRRRKKKKSKDNGHHVLAHVKQALNEDVSITVDGKSVKAKAGEVFARRLVKQGVGGSLSDQLKLARFLHEHGDFESQKIIEEIQEEHSYKLQVEYDRYSTLLDLFRESTSIAVELDTAVRNISRAFVAAKSKCTCEAFEGDEEAYQLIVAWTLDEDPEASLADELDPLVGGGPSWAPMAGVTFPGGPDAAGPVTESKNPNNVHQNFPADDLSAGKIGSD